MAYQALEAEVNVRVVEGRATYFKAITTFWGLTSDLLLCLFPFTRTMATSLMAPDFWCCVVATVVLRLCALPSVDLQQKDAETVILFLNALCVGIGPRSQTCFLDLFCFTTSGVCTEHKQSTTFKKLLLFNALFVVQRFKSIFPCVVG